MRWFILASTYTDRCKQHKISMFRILRAAFCALFKLNVMSPTLSKPRITLWPADDSTCFYMAEIFRNGCKINCKHNSIHDDWLVWLAVFGLAQWNLETRSPQFYRFCLWSVQRESSRMDPLITQWLPPTLVLIMNISVYSTGFQGFSASYRKWTPCYHMEIWLTEGYTETDSYLIRKPTNHQQFGSSVSTILQY